MRWVKQIALYINQHYGEYDRIIVDTRFGDKNYYYYGVPSLYIPFYTYLDPSKMQNAKIIPFGIAFDKYEFRTINWDAEKIQKDYLYVVPYDSTPSPSASLNVVYRIQLPDHRYAFSLYSK